MTTPHRSSPQDQLRDMLMFGHHRSPTGALSSHDRALIARQLYACIWSNPDWRQYYLVDQGRSAAAPGNGASLTTRVEPDAAGSSSSSSSSHVVGTTTGPSSRDRIPAWDNIEAWLSPPIHQFEGSDRGWSLLDLQLATEERLRRSGKATRKPKPGATCGKVLNRWDRTYICKTCANEATCILCVDCFQAGNHEGHEVLFGQSYTFATVCDCGDPAAWKSDAHVGCTHHPPLPPGEERQTPRPKVPQALCHALYETIVTILDFIIHVMQHSPLPTEFSKLPADEAEMRLGEGASGEPDEIRGQGPWAVTIWTDEKHVLREITRQIRDATGISWEEADAYVKEVDEVGRKVICVSSSAPFAFNAASMAQQIDLVVTLRHAFDTYKEEVVGFILGWLAELCKLTIAGEEDVVRRLVAVALFESLDDKPTLWTGRPLAPDLKDLATAVKPDTKRIDWLMRLDARLWKRAKWQLREIFSGIFVLSSEIKKDFATRFAVNYVFTFEHYLYHDRDNDYNMAFSMSYLLLGRSSAGGDAILNSGLYQAVLDTAYVFFANRSDDGRLNTDRGGLERFDVSSYSFRGKKGLTLLGHLRALLRYKEIKAFIIRDTTLFQRTIGFLNAFVGLQPQTRAVDDHVEYEVDWVRSFSVLADLSKLAREFAEVFRHVRPYELLNGLAYICNRILIDLMLVSKTLDPTVYHPPVEHDIKDILVPGTLHTIIAHNTAFPEVYSFHHHMHFIFAEILKSLTSVCFAADPSCYSEETFRDMIEKSVFRIPDRENAERMKMMLIEWPIQKHVLLSQIRLGMWAKNGMVMRAQYHHYREMQQREYTIDQEFYLLQFGLCILDPLKLISSLIEHYGLADYFRSDTTSPDVWEANRSTDPTLVIAMMEEFLLLVIYLVSDTASVNNWSQEKITRKFAIQALALGPLTYSELNKRLPERSNERGNLLRLLATISDFRPPTETATGLFILKSECFDDVDPFWRHYNRNDQREAMDILVARAKKADPSNLNPIVLPPPLEIPPSPLPFSNLADLLSSVVAPYLVHWTIAHCMSMDKPDKWPGVRPASEVNSQKVEMPPMDALLSIALHLALLSCRAAPEQFANYSTVVIELSGSMTTFQCLWYMQDKPAYQQFRPQVDYLLEQIGQHLPEHLIVEYRNERAAREAAAKIADEIKSKPDAKALAQARQRELKAKFAKDQASFASNFIDNEDDDLIEEGDEPVSYGSCIVCQESVHVDRTGGMLAYLQPSRIVRDAISDRDWFEEILAVPTDLDRATRYLRYGMGTTGEPTSTDAYSSTHLRFGAYVSACGHIMHDQCVNSYNDLTRTRQASQIHRHQPENSMRHEFFCPLCKTIGNILIPLDPTTSPHRPNPVSKVVPGFPPKLSERIRTVSEEGLLRVSDSAKIWDYHVETGELVPWFTDCDFSRHTLDFSFRKGHKSISRMVDRLRSLTRPLSEQSQRIRGKKTHMYLPDDMVGYTVSILEIAHRGIGASDRDVVTVAEQISETQLKLVKQLVNLLQLELDLFFGTQHDRTPLRVGIFARFLPDWYRSATLPSPLLFRQPLGMVIETAAIAPDLLHAVIVMAYYAELTRTMLGLSVYIRRSLQNRSNAQPRTVPMTDYSLQDGLAVFADFRPIMVNILRNAGPFIDTETVLASVTDDMLSKILYAFTIPFLRRAAIVYYAVNGKYPVEDTSFVSNCEYDRLLCKLAIPRPKETLANSQSTESPIVARWLTQWAMQGRILPPLEYPGTYELARLPSAYEVAAIKYAGARCDKCGIRPTYPALCLFCGKLVCLSGDCCSEGEQGECNQHMKECGGVVGMFVDIKRWGLLYLFAGSGSFAPMPYLDQFGELETSLRRGHRQYLHAGRMEELRRNIWLLHGVPTLCARKLELTMDNGGWTCM